MFFVNKNVTTNTSYPTKNRGSSVDAFQKTNSATQGAVSRTSNLIGNHSTKIANVFHRGQVGTYGLGIEVIKIDGVVDRKPSVVRIPTERQTPPPRMKYVPSVKPKLPVLVKPVENKPKPIISPIVPKKDIKNPTKPKIQRKPRKVKKDVPVQQPELTHDASDDSLKLNLNIKQSGIYDGDDRSYVPWNHGKFNVNNWGLKSDLSRQNHSEFQKNKKTEFSDLSGHKSEFLQFYQNESSFHAPGRFSDVGITNKSCSFVRNDKSFEIFGNCRKNRPDSFTRPDVDDDSEGENDNPKDYSIDAYFKQRLSKALI